jgi:alkanesulfonate monooxygenase SsuD/methylene tetrahydromethanopterin reductase-like flavin-dependent oxidoreductase (luciferase family)
VLSFGVKTSQTGVSYDEIRRIWLEADQLPVFADAWLWDHMVPLRGDIRGAALEAWTLLAALATQTSRLRLGVIVTSNRLRPPALLAKMAATVDQISGGRLVFGIGAGGSRVADDAGREMVRREFEAYGIEMVSPGEAVSALAEACTIARRMWTETELFDFDGAHYQLKGAVCEPKPVQRPHPPIMIGAGGDRALRVVAEHADIWNCPAWTADDLRRKGRVLDQHCAAIGRDPGTIVRSVQILLRSDDLAAARQQLLDYVDAGATHLVIAPVPPAAPLRTIVAEVIEPVRARAS